MTLSALALDQRQRVAASAEEPRHPQYPHLHLHLEPEERKRRMLALAVRDFSSRQQFFDAHRTDRDDRFHVTAEDLRCFLAEVHVEQHRQKVDHVELRLSPRRFLLDGMTWPDFVDTVQESLGNLRDPVMRAVLLVNRNSSASFLAAVTDRIADLPPVFTGIDIAGDEISHPDVRPFVPLVGTAAVAGLGRTVHAGEFGPVDHIWRALDELGAQRIGHGVSGATSPALLRRMARERILVEISLTSNVALGAVERHAAHPLLALVEAGVPVAFNSDVPLHTGYTLEDELELVADVLAISLQEVRDLQSAAAEYRFRR